MSGWLTVEAEIDIATIALADNGGSNGPGCRAWKHQLQVVLSDRRNLEVTVCQYPPGASKWNPIERPLFHLGEPPPLVGRHSQFDNSGNGCT